jgi:hypothetical protein
MYTVNRHYHVETSERRVANKPIGEVRAPLDESKDSKYKRWRIETS